MARSRVAHDHIVLLLRTEEFENPPAWLADNFNIIEGGTHAGGSSRNKLIVFKDGTYLELFNWIGEPKEFLAWANRPPGLIDNALTTLHSTTARDNYETITAALKAPDQAAFVGITYQEPQAGGRKRKDNVEVKWQTTRPEYSAFANGFPEAEGSYQDQKDRHEAPFFCHDVTDRAVRVPFADENITNHPCGAIGISNVHVTVHHEVFDAFVAFYSALLGIEGKMKNNKRVSAEEYAVFRMSTPNPNAQDPNSFLTIEQNSPEVQLSRLENGKGGSDPELSRNNVFLKERGMGVSQVVLRMRYGYDDDMTPAPLSNDTRKVGWTILV